MIQGYFPGNNILISLFQIKRNILALKLVNVEGSQNRVNFRMIFKGYFNKINNMDNQVNKNYSTGKTVQKYKRLNQPTKP